MLAGFKKGLQPSNSGFNNHFSLLVVKLLLLTLLVNFSGKWCLPCYTHSNGAFMSTIIFATYDLGKWSLGFASKYACLCILAPMLMRSCWDGTRVLVRCLIFLSIKWLSLEFIPFINLKCIILFLIARERIWWLGLNLACFGLLLHRFGISLRMWCVYSHA